MTKLGNDYSQEENELMRHVSEKRAIFISYIELNQYLKGESVIEDKKAIDLMIDRVYQLGFNMIILQVRSFSDAIYPSSIFPWSSTVSSGEGVNPGYDVLKYFLKKTHQKNMMLYAWINPYRIRSTEDVFSITDINPAFSYLNTDTIWIKDGIYYNPSKIEVENLIVSGVLELVKNYSVDGVLFDDYFYPSQEIDLEDYQNYLNDHDNLSLSDYHLM